MLLLLLRANRMYLSAFCSLTIQTISFSLSIAYLSTYLRYIFLKSFPDIIYRAKYIKFSFFFWFQIRFLPFPQIGCLFLIQSLDMHQPKIVYAISMCTFILCMFECVYSRNLHNTNINAIPLSIVPEQLAMQTREKMPIHSCRFSPKF